MEVFGYRTGGEEGGQLDIPVRGQEEVAMGPQQPVCVSGRSPRAQQWEQRTTQGQALRRRPRQMKDTLSPRGGDCKDQGVASRIERSGGEHSTRAEKGPSACITHVFSFFYLMML